jgi:hypothetical protein
MENQQILDLENQITSLRQTVENLNAEVFRGNFSARQDFSKYSNFSSTLKVPSYVTAPSKCEIGEIIEVGGKLCICSTANNFTIVGSQS